MTHGRSGAETASDVSALWLGTGLNSAAARRDVNSHDGPNCRTHSLTRMLGISLVPVLDQVMDARDITGVLFNINKRGGFAHAGADQLVNLGFAGFGAVPEVGSAFKTVFKPLWKERRAVVGRSQHSPLLRRRHCVGGPCGAVRAVGRRRRAIQAAGDSGRYTR
jgi:hypothetical protein